VVSLLTNHIAKDTKVSKLLGEIENHLKGIYSEKLKKIILYGSYARNESSEGSDIDIMVLLDADDEEIKKYREKVLDVVVDLTTRYGIVISIIENSATYFSDWADDIPFFSKVKEEGVEIYG
jgi:uncharacterized protein